MWLLFGVISMVLLVVLCRFFMCRFRLFCGVISLMLLLCWKWFFIFILVSLLWCLLVSLLMNCWCLDNEWLCWQFWYLLCMWWCRKFLVQLWWVRDFRVFIRLWLNGLLVVVLLIVWWQIWVVCVMQQWDLVWFLIFSECMLICVSCLMCCMVWRFLEFMMQVLCLFLKVVIGLLGWLFFSRRNICLVGVLCFRVGFCVIMLFSLFLWFFIVLYFQWQVLVQVFWLGLWWLMQLDSRQCLEQVMYKVLWMNIFSFMFGICWWIFLIFFSDSLWERIIWVRFCCCQNCIVVQFIVLVCIDRWMGICGKCW